jgi:hypothetical protein
MGEFDMIAAFRIERDVLAGLPSQRSRPGPSGKNDRMRMDIAIATQESDLPVALCFQSLHAGAFERSAA